jgi:hypothetical protein
VIFVAAPHSVHVVMYLLPRGMTGMKKSVKNDRIRVTAWAAGVWHLEQSWSTMASRWALRLNPNKMNIPVPPAIAPSPSRPRSQTLELGRGARAAGGRLWWTATSFSTSPAAAACAAEWKHGRRPGRTAPTP